MTTRSKYIPIFTNTETIKRAGSEVRIFLDHRVSGGTRTLQKSIVYQNGAALPWESKAKIVLSAGAPSNQGAM